MLARALCNGVGVADVDSRNSSGEEASLDESFPRVDCLEVLADGVGDRSPLDDEGLSESGRDVVASVGEGRF